MASKLFWHNIYNGLHLISLDLERDNFIPDAIVGVGRGGLIPATLLAYKYNVKPLFNYTIQSYSDENLKTNDFVTFQEPGVDICNYKHKNVLVVDDLSDSGDTLLHIVDKLKHQFFLEKIKVATLAIKEGTRFLPDYYSQQYPADVWLSFPWEEINFTA
jgi:hypoxanthine phosphoribosyltransferase